MSHRFIIVIALFLTYTSSDIYAQEATKGSVPKKWAVKMSPQHFLNSTLKLEVEKVLSDQKFSLVVSPFFVSKDIWGDHKKDEIWGTGGEVLARLYFAKNNRNMKGFYSSIGLNYHYYNSRAGYKGWKVYEEEGLQYLKYATIRKTHEINRVGVLFLMGYQLNFNNTVIFDFYQGFGLKQSFSPNGDEALKRYDYHFMDYSYSGLDFRIGAKVGLVL